jgi:hypothetical protein
MIKINVPYNWQVDNEAIVREDLDINFKGSSQCGPQSACMFLSTWIPDFSKDSFVKKYIMRIDKDWISGKKENRISSFQANHVPIIQLYLNEYKISRTVLVVPYGGKLELVIQSLENGSPLVLSTKLTSAGHYIVIVGWDEKARDFICHDPFGVFDFDKKKYKLIKDQVGAFVRYGYDDIMPFLEMSSKAASNNKFGGMRFIYSVPK